MNGTKLMGLSDEELRSIPQTKSVLKEFKRRWYRDVPKLMREAGINLDSPITSGELILNYE